MPRSAMTPEQRAARVAELRTRREAESQARVDYIWEHGELPPENDKPKTNGKTQEQKEKTKGKARQEELPEGVTLADFVGYMPTHSYIYIPTREMWPAASVNSRIPL